MIEEIKYFIKIFWIKILRGVGKYPSQEPIPKGMYCYEPVEFPSEENGHEYKTRPCPYYKSFRSGRSACLYVGYMGHDIVHWDQCKICSIKKPS